MPIVVTDSIILQAFRYGETSKILRLLTASHGVRSAMAKGALRPRSRFGSVLGPFVSGAATIYVKENRELQTLSGFEPSRSHQRLGTDLLRFGGASLIAELVMRTGSEEPHAELFRCVERTLDRIEHCEAHELESVILTATWTVVSLLGFTPELEQCLQCGRLLGGDEDARFDPAAGSVRCAACALDAPGRSIPAHARGALASMAAGVAVPLEQTLGHWRLISMFLDHHVLEGGSLKSFSFLSATLEARRCAS